MADQPKNDNVKEEAPVGEPSSTSKKDSARRAKGSKPTKEERRAAKARAKAERANEEAAARRRKERERRTGHSAGNRDRRNLWLIVASVVLLIVSAALFMPPNEKINQGLDIQGGLSVVLSAQSTDGEEVTAEDMEKSRSIIESRVNALGASEATVQVQGTNQILVQIPGLTDSETALETIGKTGKLEFARADSFTDAADQQAIANGTYMTQETVTDDFGNTFAGQGMVYRSVEAGTYTPLITGENITRVTVDKASETGSDYAVNITLDAEGTEAFAQATRELAPDHGQIVIVLDGEIQSAPAVQSEITGGNVSITGNYTLEEAQALQTVLESGSLPVSFQYEQSQVVGPTLGQDALASGMLAAVLGLVVVVLYLLFFYRGMGVIAAVAMGAFAVLYLGVLALLSSFGLFSLSLAGLAGVVLTIGITADSSILALERFREEIRMGRSVRAASQTGVRHAIQTAIDADLVTVVSALTLFFLASASVKGFGLTLTLGIVCDIILLFLLKAPLIRLLAPRSIAKHPGFWGLSDCHRAAEVYDELAEAEGVSTSAAMEGEGINAETAHSYIPDEGRRAQAKELAGRLKGRFVAHDLNIVGVRKILFSISAALIVLSIAVVGIKGLDFGIEFVGGTSATFHDTGDISIEEMRAAFNEEGEPDAIVQKQAKAWR